MDKVAKMLAAGLGQEDICMLQHAEELLDMFKECLPHIEHMARAHDHLQSARFLPSAFELLLSYTRAIENTAQMIEDADTLQDSKESREALQKDIVNAKELLAQCEAKHELLRKVAN